jgi:NAD(P)-dependent dehydrogenase (short-subunit alcohol dehydrogenase family)
MGKKLDGAVVVVTGASSGIGRATGLAFAERGVRVVVAARRVDALEELARECQAAGGQALAVPTDTTDEAAVTELARRAVERFGRIDIWVNNAGVYLFGLLEGPRPTPSGGCWRPTSSATSMGPARYCPTSATRATAC